MSDTTFAVVLILEILLIAALVIVSVKAGHK
jgi:hypothetical protein